MTSRLLVDKIEGKTTANSVAMPSGSVVQTSFHSFSTETVLSSDSDADIGSSTVTFTPKFASSLLILSCSVHIHINRGDSNNGGTYNFVVDGVNINHAADDYEHYINMNSSNTNNYTRSHKEVSISASNTNTKTIKLTGRVHATGSSGVFRINAYGNFTSSIKIQEIAQ